jgi:transcriptional regulator with XRE-family HTH domain
MRGKRSQVAWSRRLGYRSNVAYAWEAGRRWPTAAETFRAAGRAHIDVQSALASFYGKGRPQWLDQLEPHSPEAVAMLLQDHLGNTSITEVASRMDTTRSTVSRWLSGNTQPRLPDFLRLLQVLTLRLVDLLAELVDPTTLPSVAPSWARLEARRKGAFEFPWTQAILRALEMNDYQALQAHQPGWIASRIGISEEEELRCLDFMAHTGQIRWTDSRWQHEPISVDTRRSPGVGAYLKAHWTAVAADRMRAGKPGQFSYNVFTVSREDFERIRELHLSYFHALRAVVEKSEPGECVAVANIHLFALDD